MSYFFSIPQGDIERKITKLFKYNAVDTNLPKFTWNYRKGVPQQSAIPNLSQLRCECKICQILRQPNSLGGRSVKVTNLSKSNSESQQSAASSSFANILNTIKQLPQKETDQLIAILLKKRLTTSPKENSYNYTNSTCWKTTESYCRFTGGKK